MSRSPRFLIGLVSIAGTIAAIVYFGWFLYYFFDVGGSWQGTWDIGLGPTVVGLGAIGVIFVLVLVFKVMRLLRKPNAGGPGTPHRPSSPDEDNGFDADAVISRYMARRGLAPEQGAPGEAVVSQQASAPSTFGRRTNLS